MNVYTRPEFRRRGLATEVQKLRNRYLAKMKYARSQCGIGLATEKRVFKMRLRTRSSRSYDWDR